MHTYISIYINTYIHVYVYINIYAWKERETLWLCYRIFLASFNASLFSNHLVALYIYCFLPLYLVLCRLKIGSSQTMHCLFWREEIQTLSHWIVNVSSDVARNSSDDLLSVIIWSLECYHLFSWVWSCVEYCVRGTRQEDVVWYQQGIVW